MRLIFFLAFAFMFNSTAFAVEINLKCGQLNGYSTYVATSLRPGELTSDSMLNGTYRFKISATQNIFQIFFESIEGIVERPVNQAIIKGSDKAVFLLSKRENVDQRFFINTKGGQYKLVYLSEMHLLDGEIQISSYAANCQKTD